jgi:acetylornithine deacetylase/succinyl-diaminopimelate desuccinylase-like protein
MSRRTARRQWMHDLDDRAPVVPGVTPTHDTVTITMRVPHGVSEYELAEYLRAYLEPRGGALQTTHIEPNWHEVRQQQWLAQQPVLPQLDAVEEDDIHG